MADPRCVDPNPNSPYSERLKDVNNPIYKDAAEDMWQHRSRMMKCQT